MIVSSNNKLITYLKNIIPKKKTTVSFDKTKLLPHIKKPILEFSPVTDVFERKDYSQIIAGLKNDSQKRILANKFLKNHHIDEKTYKKLSPTELELIRSQLNDKTVEHASTLIKSAKVLKNIFDKNYGEGQYTFVSIGRSLSALAKCMEFMGVETKQIPLSGCGGYRNKVETVNIMFQQPAFKDYKKFLKETLTRDNNKTYIFGDYACNGTTLDTFKYFINHPDVNLGHENDKYFAINKTLKDFAEYEPKTSGLARRFDNLLNWQSYDDYAEIGYLNYNSLSKLSTSLKPTHESANKLMKFCVLDMLKTSEK